MRHLLSILPKPSRYVGIEEGSVHKNVEEARLRVALAFPDMYEVGMSYLGQKILYGLINEREGWLAERVFTPCAEAGAILKEHSAPLCSLESDLPLAEFDVIGFSLTHELCYTNILYMLDLAGIPFHSSQRLDSPVGGPYPLIVAGGGCTLAAEPVAPFFDAMFLGDGEEVLVEFLELAERAKHEKRSKAWMLEEASRIPGVYVPAFFAGTDSRTPPLPLREGYTQVTRRAVRSLDDTYYPVSQPVPFGAVHNRLTLEIARGCTRSCRFCQAGIIYRPVRERSVANLEELMDRCLAGTGYDDVSYLSLSTGDFSALKTFFHSTIDRCAAEQISVSLPSLRVGSIDDSIMERMAGIRRTGATLAPEAGSQRLRDVINKGITEEEIILHTQKLFEHGWQQIKLYFMIGLPTETDEDLEAIIALCRKVRDAAGPGIKRLQVTASVSPFVPKPHTPFQWERQIPLEEIKRRIGVLLTLAKAEKRIKLRWHESEMSFLEGVFSRGDRRLAPVVESAYRKGALFTSWIDQFKLAPWLEALEEHGLDALEFTAALEKDAALPWEHLQSGVSKDFLLRELNRGLEEKITQDCRYYSCRQCGVCDTKAGESSLYKKNPGEKYQNILNLPQRDQAAHEAKLDEYGRVITRVPHKDGEKNEPPALAAALVAKVCHYRLWYRKVGPASVISQLELQSIFERALRRNGIPLSFSQGFKPAPLLSFARALSVGVSSECEWFSMHLRENRSPQEVLAAFTGMPLGLEVYQAVKIPLNQRPAEALSETYQVAWAGSPERLPLFTRAVEEFRAKKSLLWTKKGKKHDKELDARLMVPVIRQLTGANRDSRSAGLSENASAGCLKTATAVNTSDTVVFEFVFDWSYNYASPLALTLGALGLALPEELRPAETDKNEEGVFSAHELLLTKTAQSEGNS